MVSIKRFYHILKRTKSLHVFLLMIFVIGALVDIFFIPVPAFTLQSDFRLFLLLFLWIFLSKISDFNSSATLKIALGFVIILYILFISSNVHPALDRAASWVYFFLVIGIIQQFFESRKI